MQNTFKTLIFFPLPKNWEATVSKVRFSTFPGFADLELVVLIVTSPYRLSYYGVDIVNYFFLY